MFQSNFNKEPVIQVKGFEDDVWRGYQGIVAQLKKEVKTTEQQRVVLTVECYPGVNDLEVLTALEQGLQPVLLIHSDEASYSGETITNMIEENLTDDRVLGLMCHRKMDDFFDPVLLAEQQNKIKNIAQGLVLVYGVGASLIHPGDILVYADMARWEIQQRYRSKQLGNWKMDNYDEDVLRKYKRGFFVEWRVADRLKKKLYNRMDYLLDTNAANDPKMVTGKAFLAGLKETAHRPFSLVPYFDAGVWGGQWMKKVCGLDPEKENYAWSFNGVPEENSIFLQYGDVRVEVPSINVVFRHPKELLGSQVYARFGAEFPIRFDYLDTVEGQNLSLQVHPLTGYIQENFGMNYTQDESYYILDAKDKAQMYLGLKENVDPQALVEDLRRAEQGEISFPDEKYINQYEVKKHDHISIPSGTIHCAADGTMVLEISATPYIFTFKLWDWDRLGLDGLPRPVHIEHGKNSIQWDRDSKWVEKELLTGPQLLDSGDGWTEERTGLHHTQFIETRRYWFSKPVLLHTCDNVNMLTLVEGNEAVVESPTGDFEPFVVHYAETFIVPASVGAYRISPRVCGESESCGGKCAIIRAYVRG